jgi:D-inositol-3-phosphate glycosyltransferase
VASDDGGLPETQCGSLHLVEPDNSEALAIGIIDALSCDRVGISERDRAARCFTVGESVDALLGVLCSPQPITPFRLVQELEELISLPSNPQLSTQPSEGCADAVV